VTEKRNDSSFEGDRNVLKLDAYTGTTKLYTSKEQMLRYVDYSSKNGYLKRKNL
jgi:hypothetical protein